MYLSKQHHIAVICSDYAKAKEFYVDKLGFRLVREVYREAQGDYLRMLRLGDTVLELFIRPDAPRRVTNPEALGLRHLAFHVEDVEKAAAWLNSLGIDYDPSTCSIPEPTLRALTAVCGLLSPAALVGFILLDRHATKHTWWCIFSRAEVKFYLAKGERLYRTRYEQENQQAGVVIVYVFLSIVTVLAVVMAVMNLMGQSLYLPDF